MKRLMPAGVLLPKLREGEQLRAQGMHARDVAEKVGLSYTSYNSAAAVYRASQSEDPEVAALGQRELEIMNHTGSIQPSYERVRALFNGTASPAPWRDRQTRISHGKIHDVMPRSMQALQALTLAFDGYSAEDFANLPPELRQEWLQQVKDFRAVLFQFVKKLGETTDA